MVCGSEAQADNSGSGMRLQCGDGLEVGLQRGSGVLGNKRLLVVDDSRAIRSFLEARLSPYFRVTLAEDGEQGLKCALEHPFELILSDINMPGLNGFQLYSRIHARFPSQPFALMTDADIDGYLGDALDADVQHIIAKAAFRADFDGTLRLLQCLTRGIVGGMEQRMGAGGEVRKFLIGSTDDLPHVLEQCRRILHRFPRHDTYLRILPELLRNVLSEGWGHPSHSNGPMDLLTLSVGADWQRVGFGVRDSVGLWTRPEVLRQLYARYQQSTPVQDSEHGIVQSRWRMDQAFITVMPGNFTEILCFDLLNGYKGHRSLHVAEWQSANAHLSRSG